MLNQPKQHLLRGYHLCYTGLISCLLLLFEYYLSFRQFVKFQMFDSQLPQISCMVAIQI